MTNKIVTDQEHITALKIVKLLEESAQDLDATILARLADSRQQAVAAMGQTQHVLQLAMVGWSTGWHQLQHLSEQGQRFWLPVIVLLAALAAMLGSHWNTQRNIDTDSQLLAAELPPEAYADKEFVTWLEATSRQ
ncbi:MAG: DUF3619 family protein [Methylophilales bacterium]|nr:DUF3619 family protein [Methylophilales bacterium]